MNAYLGIDIGTSGTKVLAIDAQGKVLSVASREYPCYAPKPLWSEQDPEDWWQAVLAAVPEAVAKAGLSGCDVKGIGLSGQMHGSVFLDRQDKVIRPAILWNDQRTAAECQEIEQAVGGRDKLIELVANPAMSGFTAPKIVWLRNNEPENFDKVAKVLLPKDEIRRRLTGEYATEVSDASGTLLLDVAHRRWSQETLSALGLDSSLLPTVYESEDTTGKLSASAAEALGLTTDCIVVGGAGDCAAGAVGNGIVRPGVTSTSLGTSGVVFVHSDELKYDKAGRIHTFCHAVRGKWHMMGVTLSAAGSLQWFRNALCQELWQRAKEQGRDIYELLTAEASQTRQGADGLFFLPYLSGERTPHADPYARGAFIGLTLAHDRRHMARAILEGVVYSLRDSVEIFRSLNVPISEIRASGGGAKSAFWRQMQADMFGSPVTTLNSEEGPAYGVALLATVGAGEYNNIEEACDATISRKSQTEPNQEAQTYYDQAFPVYQRLYQALKEEFRAIAQLP
ncbi:MAG: xylulokinase [Planctomycetia bacterium]|nr:xylulokinase [Planctomycetia bacterium]